MRTRTPTRRGPGPSLRGVEQLASHGRCPRPPARRRGVPASEERRDNRESREISAGAAMTPTVLAARGLCLPFESVSLSTSLQ
jgi:hypothetical protein